jgi:hypothetical protein
MADKLLSTQPDHRGRHSILRLLDGFESRRRMEVVGVLLKHWNCLSAVDYGKAVDILTAFDVPYRFRDQAKDILGQGMATKNADHARRGLDRLLS